MAASERPCSSSKSLRLYQASANVGSARVPARNAASASTLRATARNQFPKVERSRCIARVAFHQDAVEALGPGNVSTLLRQLRLLKQFVGSVLRPVDAKHELAVFVGASPRLFDFEAAVRSRMKTHISEASL